MSAKRASRLEAFAALEAEVAMLRRQIATCHQWLHDECNQRYAAEVEAKSLRSQLRAGAAPIMVGDVVSVLHSDEGIVVTIENTTGDGECPQPRRKNS